MSHNAREAIHCSKCGGASIFTGFCRGEEFKASHAPEDTRRCTVANKSEHLHRVCLCGHEWITPCADHADPKPTSRFTIQSDTAGTV